ncbi:hypothetical protein C8R47DRAFT_960294 [Mycena vitilis]|nr:hypothetical protein C8R47DRAFT_960294 [Mycena vitilis]
MEVLTVFGTWDHTTGGGILFADGDGVVELIPGATIVIASGTKGYSLLPVGLGEKRYIFRQYCHASILRWVDKGGRSDKEFDADAPYEEVLAWNRKRADRGRTSLKMFSRLADVYI